jgi:hypothetical protein
MCHNRYRLKAKLNIDKFEVKQYIPIKRGYVAIPTAGSGWKSHISKDQKK